MLTDVDEVIDSLGLGKYEMRKCFRMRRVFNIGKLAHMAEKGIY